MQEELEGVEGAGGLEGVEGSGGLEGVGCRRN